VAQIRRRDARVPLLARPAVAPSEHTRVECTICYNVNDYDIPTRFHCWASQQWHRAPGAADGMLNVTIPTIADHEVLAIEY
jgi:hypothetical protein